MPNVILNRNVFEKLVGKKLPEDQLKDRISMLGTDLDSVSSDEIHVEIFPNRPDMLSEQGFARAFASFIGTKTGLRAYKAEKSGKHVLVEKSVAKVRPYTVCAIVTGLKLDDEKIREIVQIQEKLHITYGRNRSKCAIGIYPSEEITYPIHYKALAPEKIVFRPLEHPNEINGLQILTEHPKGRSFAHLLEGKAVYPIFVDDAGKILSMPPIINSHDVGKVTEDTTEVFIEFSGFDLSVLNKGLNMLLCTLAEMGGKVYSMDVVYADKSIGKITTPDLSPEEMKFDLSYVNQMLGLDLSEKEVKSLLERMGYGVKKGSVLVPPYRADILHQIDLVEDIAIAHGYEKFEPTIPNVATVGQEGRLASYAKVITDILAGQGLLEVNTYHITNDHNQSRRMQFDAKTVRLANALTTDFDVLRSWMIPSLMEVLHSNKHNEYPQNLFGFGTVFKHGKDEATTRGSLVEEALRVGVSICSEEADFTIIKQHFDHLMRMLDVTYEMEPTEHPSFIPGRVARVNVNGKGVAYIGEIAPRVLLNWEVEMPVAAFELNVSDLLAQVSALEL